MTVRCSHTADAILQAAMKLFSQRGYGGVSIRDITKSADANIGAINYHFGSKRELYIAVFEIYFQKITDERYAMLAACEEAAGESPPSVTAVLQALIKPLIQVLNLKGGIEYLRIYGSFVLTPLEVVDDAYIERILPVRYRFIEAFLRCEPRLNEGQVLRIFGLVSATLVGAIYDHSFELFGGTSAIRKDINEFSDLLVTYTAAGVRGVVQEN
jgi:AcrR family transcriptional regulator